MVGLIDIAPASASVPIRGQEVDVCGVSASGIAALLGRFPELRKMISGRQPNVDELMAMGGEIVAAIIAAGTGALGNPDAEAAADRLSVQEQVDLLLAISRVTLPDGVGPLVEKITGAKQSLGVGNVGVAVSGEGPATKSAQPSKS